MIEFKVNNKTITIFNEEIKLKKSPLLFIIRLVIMVVTYGILVLK